MLSGLIQCADCKSSMTNTFTNKIKRRYYYYKCYKVVREGKSACSIREVNAEKLESFLIENLSRIAQDNQYIENLVFRMAYSNPAYSGFELKGESMKKLVTRVQEVLINFKKKAENSSQVEKCLLFKKIFQRIKFSKDYLEVSISIEDTENNEIFNLSGKGSTKAAARIRGEHPYPCAPSRTYELEQQTGAVEGIRTLDLRRDRAAL